MFGSREKHDRTKRKEPRRCSFCNKDQAEVAQLVAGPTAFICDECVQICVDIIKDDARANAREESRDAAEARARATAERLNRDRVRAEPQMDAAVPAWHVRCPLCENIVPTEEAMAIAGRGVLCQACVLAVQSTTLHSTQ